MVFADMKYFIGISWYEIESGNSEIKAYSISNLRIECNFSLKWEGKTIDKIHKTWT